MRVIDELRRRIAPTIAEEDADPLRWRERVLFALLAMSLVLGVITAVPSVWLAWRDGLYWTLVVDVVALTLVATLTLHPRLPFAWRAGGLIAACYGVGVFFLVTVGLVSQIYLMAVPILAALLLGLRAGTAALILVSVTLGVVGFYSAADLPMGKYEGSPHIKWWLISINFLFVDATLTFSVAVLLRRLERSLQREQAQLAERERLTRAVEESSEGIVICDDRGRVEYANRAGALLTGGAKVVRLGEINTTSEHRIADALQRGVAWRGTLHADVVQGASREIDVAITPLSGGEDGTRRVVAVLRDITHERAMEERLRQGEKLEALGTLAGGISHDFNNIIASILAVAELERSEAARDSDTAAMDHIIVACQRARDIVRKMMVFSRQDVRKRRPVRLAKVLEEALPLLRASIPTTIAFESSITATGYAEVDPAEIHQILMNLATNAAQAMPNGGTLSFALMDLLADVDTTHEWPTVVEGERYLMFEVADTGVGIPPEHLERIFDPFFTTKHPSEGTGLGLASVHGIVRSLGGEITVTSVVGSGTTFRILLPAIHHEEASAPSGAEPLSAAVGPASARRVLVVDDEPLIVQVHERILSRAGYHVTVAHEGLEAQRLLEDSTFRVDLLVTDLSMPGASGLDIIRTARVRHPGVKVILSSGFGSAAPSEALDAARPDAFLQKPYDLSMLLRTVERLLATG